MALFARWPRFAQTWTRPARRRLRARPYETPRALPPPRCRAPGLVRSTQQAKRSRQGRQGRSTTSRPCGRLPRVPSSSCLPTKRAGREAKAAPACINGNTGPQDWLAQFQDEPSVRPGVLSISAAGVGLTLTAASVIVIADLHYNLPSSTRRTVPALSAPATLLCR